MYQSRIRDSKKKHQRKREFIEPATDGSQEYAIVQDMVGNGRVRVFCEDKKSRIARIRGSMRKYSKKVIIGRGDLVLISFRDFGGTTHTEADVDLFHKYMPDEVANMVRFQSLPENIHNALITPENDNGKPIGENYVVFMEDDTPAPDAEGGRDTDSSKSGDQSDDDSEVDVDAI